MRELDVQPYFFAGASFSKERVRSRGKRVYAPSEMALAHYFTIVALFALWATAHLLLCIELAKRDFRKGAAGFFAFPMAPYFGQNLRIKTLPTLWVVSALLYLTALLIGAI